MEAVNLKWARRETGLVNHSKMLNTSLENAWITWQFTTCGLAIELLLEILRLGINQQMLFIRYDDLSTTPAKAGTLLRLPEVAVL